jgi:hypothetical protein
VPDAAKALLTRTARVLVAVELAWGLFLRVLAPVAARQLVDATARVSLAADFAFTRQGFCGLDFAWRSFFSSVRKDKVGPGKWSTSAFRSEK